MHVGSLWNDPVIFSITPFSLLCELLNRHSPIHLYPMYKSLQTIQSQTPSHALGQPILGSLGDLKGLVPQNGRPKPWLRTTASTTASPSGRERIGLVSWTDGPMAPRTFMSLLTIRSLVSGTWTDGKTTNLQIISHGETMFSAISAWIFWRVGESCWELAWFTAIPWAHYSKTRVSD